MHNAYDDSLASYDGLPFPLWLLPRSPSPFSLFLFCATVFLFGEDGTISFLGASAWGVASPLSPLPPLRPLSLSLSPHTLSPSRCCLPVSPSIYILFSVRTCRTESRPGGVHVRPSPCALHAIIEYFLSRSLAHTRIYVSFVKPSCSWPSLFVEVGRERKGTQRVCSGVATFPRLFHHHTRQRERKRKKRKGGTSHTERHARILLPSPLFDTRFLHEEEEGEFPEPALVSSLRMPLFRSCRCLSLLFVV